MFDSEKIRQDFKILREGVNGIKPVYFDSACMSLKPDSVVESMNEYYYDNHVKKFGPIIAEVNDEFIEKCYKNALEMNEIGKIFDEKMFYTKDELNKINFNKASSLYYI